MKKHFLPIAILICAVLQVTAQNWQATNLANFNYPIGGVQSHKGDLYATLVDQTPSSLFKLDAGGTSWTKIITDHPGPRMIQNADDRIYISTLNSGVLTLLYYSLDGGQTMILDTAGLTPYLQGSIYLINSMQYHHGKMIIGQGNVYYRKDTSAIVWTNISNQASPLNSATDPLAWFNDTLYAFNNLSSSFYVSSDYGAAWTTRTTDLHADFVCHLMIADEITGRLYAAGFSNNNSQYALYYSDNGGGHWSPADLSAFLGTNYMHTQQAITAMYAKGQTVYIAMQNNADPSAPDVISTTTGLANLAYDTVGLPSISGAANGYMFTAHQNKIVMALNVRDVFIKSAQGTGIADEQETHITLYPNPGNGHLYINNESNIVFTTVEVKTIDGKTALSKQWQSGGIDVAELPAGMYFIQLSSADKQYTAFKYVKY